MFNSQHVTDFEDAVVRENDLVVYKAETWLQDEKVQAVGIVIKIFVDPNEEDDDQEQTSYLIRTNSGSDEVVEEADMVAVIRPAAFDELIRLYMLSKFLHFKAQDIPAQIEMRVVAEAGSHARELAIEFQARVDYRDFFRSASLSTSVDRVISRYFEDKAHEIKALPAY